VINKIVMKYGDKHIPKDVNERIKLCREILVDDLYSMAAPFLQEYGGKAISWLTDRIFNHSMLDGLGPSPLT
jgi:hypothetical protein